MALVEHLSTDIYRQQFFPQPGRRNPAATLRSAVAGADARCFHFSPRGPGFGAAGSGFD
jgi:hypothetical protein